MSLALYLFLSCERLPEPLSSDGIIRGYVRDDRAYELEGVQVTAHGPYGNSSVVTNDEGFYEFTHMGNGNYWLEFTRHDLGIRRMYNVRIFRDEIINSSIMLYKLPGEFRIPPFVQAHMAARPRTSPAEPWLCIRTSATSDNRNWYNYGFEFILYFSRTPDVTYEKYDFIFAHWDGYFWDDPICLYCDPHRLPFKKDETVYVTAYACNRNENPEQLDPYTGKSEFSTLDRTRHTNIVSFIMP